MSITNKLPTIESISNKKEYSQLNTSKYSKNESSYHHNLIKTEYYEITLMVLPNVGPGSAPITDFYKLNR